MLPSSCKRLAIATTVTATALAQTRMFSFTRPAVDGRLGFAVASAGDVDGDGFPDILAGAPLTSSAAPLAGWAGVYSGRTAALIHEFHGRAPEQGFGGGLNTVGDVDADGHADFAIGAPGDGARGVRAGRVYVFSGRTGILIYDLLGDGPGDLLGHSIAPAGDVDRDGVGDFIVGAPENGDPVQNYGAGYAKVFSGRTGAVLHRFGGAEVMFEHGHAVDGVGDLDGDGHADVVVAAVLDTVPNAGVGAARAYSGRTGEVMYVFRNAPNTDHFGMAVAGVGDVDADGVPDIAVSSVELMTALPGNVSIYSGRNGQRIRFVRAPSRSDMAGVTVCGLGDLDRDGHADFATGAPGANGGFGAVFIYRGRDGSLLRSIAGEQQGSVFGFPIAPADLNRDGYADVIVGARGAAQDRGAVWVYSGLNVSSVGIGCGDSPVPPRLAVTTPRVGQPWTTFLQSAAPLADAVLLGSAIPAVPTPLWNGRCTYYLDWSTTTYLAAVRTDGSGQALRQFSVPNVHTLVGQTLAIQAGLAGRSVPISFSNGVVATIEH